MPLCIELKEMGVLVGLSECAILSLLSHVFVNLKTLVWQTDYTLF